MPEEKVLTEENAELETAAVLEIDIARVLSQNRLNFLFKRIFDVAVSALGLIICSPLLLVISLLVLFTSRGGVFFKQIRIGKDAREFKIFKFRTMVKDAEKISGSLTIGKDKRITKIGHFLRGTKLDELPQLINVFFGDMSFVGPRPEVPKYVALYTPAQRELLRLRPGITDLASIKYISESALLAQSDDPEQTYIQVIMQEKLQLNLLYLDSVSVLNDIKIILRTFGKIFSRQ